jgi:hypothetical protein
VTAVLTAGSVAGQGAQEQLVVYGDLTYFLGPGKPLNCTLNNRYKKGDPVGFRATAINPATGKRDKATQLVVHLTYGGRTIDIPMRDRQTVKEPEREFWVAKWIVPEDAPMGTCGSRSQRRIRRDARASSNRSTFRPRSSRSSSRARPHAPASM